MKKFFLIIIVLIILYIVFIFIFPSTSSYIGDKIGLTGFNNSVVKARDNFNDFITSFDIIGGYEKTKKDVLEIKQNTENQVNETKKQIEVIQTNVDKTAKSIEETTKAVDNTINSINDLQKGKKQ